MKKDDEMKTITIHQGSGEDALEMTVQVTQAEFEKMEELRSKNPQKWPEYSLELVREAKDALENSKHKTKSKPKKRGWLWIVLIIFLAVIGYAIWYFFGQKSIVQWNDLAYHRLKGKVSSVCTLEFEALNPHDNGVVLDKLSNDELSIRRFDTLGKQIAKTSFKVINCDLRQIERFNSYGQLIETKYCHNGKITGLFNYEYNLKGEKTKITTAGNLGIDFLDAETTYSYTYQHDEKGRIVLEKEYTDGYLSTTTTKQYDDLSRIIREYSESPTYGYDRIEYSYTKNGYFKQRHYDSYDYNGFEYDQWVFDRKACRNDNIVYDKNGNITGKISYFYDKDSLFYKDEFRDADGKLKYTYYHDFIPTPYDTVFFNTTLENNAIGLGSTMYLSRVVENGYEKRKFDVKTELNSSWSGDYDTPYHQIIKTGISTVTREFDKKGNPKSQIETYDDGDVVNTSYKYSGREKKWKQISTMQLANGKKETTTDIFSMFNRLKSISSKGIEKTWEYNEIGEEISYTVTNKNKTTTNIRYSDYVYDKYGNWIRRTNYNVLSGTYTVTERCIEYY